MTVKSKRFSCNKVYAAERMTVNHDVAGSSPAGGAMTVPLKGTNAEIP